MAYDNDGPIYSTLYVKGDGYLCQGPIGGCAPCVGCLGNPNTYASSQECTDGCAGNCSGGEYDSYKCSYWVYVNGVRCDRPGPYPNFWFLDFSCDTCTLGGIETKAGPPESFMGTGFTNCTETENPDDYSYVLGGCTYNGCMDPSFIY